MLFANVRLSFGGSGAWRLPVPCDPSRLAVPGALRLPASCDPRCLAASGALRSQVPCGFRCLAASDTRFCRKRGGEVDQIGTSTAMCEICGEAMACGARSARKMRSKSGDVRLSWAEKCRCEKEIGAFGPHIGPDVPSAYAGCRTSAPTCHQRAPAAAHRARSATPSAISSAPGSCRDPLRRADPLPLKLSSPHRAASPAEFTEVCATCVIWGRPCWYYCPD